MTITIQKISSRLGAVVSGVDLTGELAPELGAELRSLLNAHKALVFDGVRVDDEQHERIASLFGPVTRAHPTVPGASDNVLAVDSERSRSNAWHTDVTFVANPPQVTTLRSLITTPYGGETLIADSQGAYRDLPEALRNLADSLRAVHTNTHDYVRADDQPTAARAEHRKVFVSKQFEAEHPVVRVHPETGERGLFIGGFVREIAGVSKADSEALLRLFQHRVTRPENVIRWSWQPDQLLVFDNRATQHYAIDNYDDLPRLLHRVTVAGDVPVGVDGRSSRQLLGDPSDYSVVAA
ncbi:TauD/TfdA family dioxygenase [Tsukamurella sp. 8F]|uniref:TauD/TfdA dioxygenase family protein n=1 Tax=unclassified Tsukamurella TaxID=2633480 RepID=UPI0023B8C631|nr:MULTISPECIES: TauD/TfdA family dioxygenase [unclassified Tsukamurella]MDF0529914.1 TauD/TfdA family dioxygenase [Tsukamurella sp. 8J]MDF0587314.1 TauD/TfdA family dioxygenase [Tsukamurella sp. 8F]